MAGTSAEELLAANTDETWRSAFADVVDLMDLLKDCVIQDKYSVPNALTDRIALTEPGREMKSRLIRQEEVPGLEAHLMCALTLGHEDLFIDVANTDIDRLSEAISDQIVARKIRFPFIFGRELYDYFAGVFEDEKDLLTNEETIQLLDATPTGVFQYGRFVVGPSGLRTSNYRRILRSSSRVPAFHCDDPVCRKLHSVVLSTGHNAAINAERGKLERLLRSMPNAAADWSGLASEISRVHESYFGNSWTAPMVTLVGDCLSMDELSTLNARLSESKTLPGLISREQFLEEVLTQFDDDEICVAIDDLVRAGKLGVPVGEVRRPVSTAHLRSGAFKLQPQLGVNGVRFVSGDPGLPVLRERDLFRRIYLDAGDAERHELDWQLRGIDGVSLEVRLDEYLRTQSPADALTRLVLSGSASAIAASELVGAGDFEGESDEEIISRLLWKLGFDDRDPEDLHAEFWRQHEKVAAAVQSWLGTGADDAADFKGKASAYFIELEGRLEDSLAFASWSLLYDHSISPRPFNYTPDLDRSVGLELLDRYTRSEEATEIGEKLRFNGKLTMYPLMRGFGVLSEVLASVRSKASDFERPESEFPKYASITALQNFPFKSTVPFLDISEHSQDRIVNGFQQIEAGLRLARVDQVRNAFSHYRRTSPEVAQMAETLESVAQAIRLIENLGFGLNLFAPAGDTGDRWGRRTVRFQGPRSLEHSISRPSSLQWAGLPSLGRNQLLVRAAAFEDANEVLRFERGYSSDFSVMWAAYPKPRRALSGIADASTAIPG
ncbi:hypothetical protein G3T36_17420 [Diaminobutyricibacter tongyongensis]|uniref:Uncharacterized protein n=1 Tax=Leifsonia tongyongensis TaxID=1268043 RepID=A0A6L9Y2X2_9MICO|nr:hypothetical protein [Diaminobutyricibacter tongyongensis]NEN07638.1 hypothetical protein [Diaminobutyricibacter tongyongensis]